MIPSVAYSNYDAIKNILELHIKADRFALDPTFSSGKFYKGLEQPCLRFDLTPTIDGVGQADCRHLPIEDGEISSIMFDPPFCVDFGSKHNNISVKRFSFFPNWRSLEAMYKESLREFYRLLAKKGHLVFKCQDFTSSGNEKSSKMTHCLVWQWAQEVGFYPKDLFILVAQRRIYNPAIVQKTARKFHSYFWVFKKV